MCLDRPFALCTNASSTLIVPHAGGLAASPGSVRHLRFTLVAGTVGP
jgi:hypothetical protein